MSIRLDENWKIENKNKTQRPASEEKWEHFYNLIPYFSALFHSFNF